MVVKETKNKPGGQPNGKWTPEKIVELAEKMTVYFNTALEVFLKDKKDKNLPFLSQFCHEVGVDKDVMVRKAKLLIEGTETLLHVELSRALKKAKEVQKHILIQGALDGRFHATAFIFTAKNITDMRDKTETDVTSKGKSISGFNYQLPEGVEKPKSAKAFVKENEEKPKIQILHETNDSTDPKAAPRVGASSG